MVVVYFGFVRREKVIIALQLLTGASFGFVRGFGMLSNMTSALNVAFQGSAHTAIKP